MIALAHTFWSDPNAASKSNDRMSQQPLRPSVFWQTTFQQFNARLQTLDTEQDPGCGHTRRSIDLDHDCPYNLPVQTRAETGTKARFTQAQSCPFGQQVCKIY
jgi:hypothetical protein